ncbi:MAG: YhgE/Pip family protein, partial [Microbacterium sp.]|uniref:YhgE/Pip family protein n=1 Tax=Microbacterium sp. TaxID=51671 RepID=UPI0039E68C86
SVSSGASQVADGAASAASGAASLSSGATSVSDGASTLAAGLPTLASGLTQLRDGLDDGVAQIPDSDADLREQQASTISDPVAISTDALTSAGDYGAGLAPFFAALAGWIGIYALFLIVKPISKRAITALHSPIRITLAGWLTPALLGGLQMAALFGILAIALGFSVANPLATLGIMVLASFTYAAIILALNVWLGSVGQFLGLVLMVLQLVTAGGTFPWQTLPAPLVGLHQVLPMGYVVDAMRQLMYGGDLARVAGDVAVLGAWMLGALVVAAIGVTRMTHRRTLRDLAPSLIG